MSYLINVLAKCHCNMGYGV